MPEYHKRTKFSNEGRHSFVKILGCGFLGAIITPLLVEIFSDSNTILLKCATAFAGYIIGGSISLGLQYREMINSDKS